MPVIIITKIKGRSLMQKHRWLKISNRALGHTMFFWPLIVMGGRLVVRVILNIWDVIEP